MGSGPDILLLIQNSLLVLTASVNALNGLTSISTDIKFRLNDEKQVSMPSTGLLPFLRGIYYDNLFDKNNVSMPSTGLLPFLLFRQVKHLYMTSCVNALNGLTSISTNMRRLDTLRNIVSMPSTGLLPFLR